MVSIFSTRSRDDSSPKGPESAFAFLDRVAGPFWDRIRAFLEDLLGTFCDDATADMLGRLRSGDDSQFYSTFWELYLHRRLSLMGFHVTCHPDVPDAPTHPDFLAVREDCSFYVEAQLLGEASDDARIHARRQDLYAHLNERLQSERFWLRIQLDEEGPQNIPFGKLAKDTQDWLDQLVLEDVQTEIDAAGSLLGATGWTWSDAKSGWQVTLIPFPKNEHKPSDRVLSVFQAEVAFVDDRTAIRKALDRKSRHYGRSLPRPLIIALGIARVFSDDADVIDALFGTEVVLFDDSGDHRMSRKHDGLWTSPRGPRPWVAAVLTVDNPTPYRLADFSPTLWLNPWADVPLACRPDDLRIVSANDDGRLDFSDKTTPERDLFGLPQEWPGPESPFPR